jgi:hypothetical protein
VGEDEELAEEKTREKEIMDVLRHPRQWAWVIHVPCLIHIVLFCFLGLGTWLYMPVLDVYYFRCFGLKCE